MTAVEALTARPFDPDLGFIDVRPMSDRDRGRWAKATNEGPWLAYPEDGADRYHEVWMLHLKGKYLFVAPGGMQYGPEHPHLCAATYWAFAHGWRDPTISASLNVACIVEVRSNSQLLVEARLLPRRPGR